MNDDDDLPPRGAVVDVPTVPSHVHTPDEIAFDVDVDPKQPAMLFHVQHVADRTTTLSSRITRLEHENDELRKAIVGVLVLTCFLVVISRITRKTDKD